MTVRILRGDCREVLRGLPDASVHCVVTSPPYFGLRDYGTAAWDGGDPSCDHRKVTDASKAVASSTLGGGKESTGHLQEGFTGHCRRCGAVRVDRQIGLEATPDAFVAEMVAVFAEVRRVLRDDGTVWLNLGDSYAGGGHGGGGSFKAERNWRRGNPEKNKGNSNRDGLGRVSGLKPKDLIGIPWRVAFALQADGWYLRQDIIWSKPNPMPESVRDRCTKAHEYLFLLSKSERYYYDAEAIREDGPTYTRQPGHCSNENPEAFTNSRQTNMSTRVIQTTGRNKRSVWEITTQPYVEAHFATFPPALIEPCILAGCPETVCSKCGSPVVREVERTPMVIDRSERTHALGQTRSSGTMLAPPMSVTKGWLPSCDCDAPTCRGTVLDPFGGAGTTGLVADRLGRNAVLIELNPDYAAMAERRISGDAPLFADVKAEL